MYQWIYNSELILTYFDSELDYNLFFQMHYKSILILKDDA